METLTRSTDAKGHSYSEGARFFSSAVSLFQVIYQTTFKLCFLSLHL